MRNPGWELLKRIVLKNLHLCGESRQYHRKVMICLKSNLIFILQQKEFLVETEVRYEVNFLAFLLAIYKLLKDHFFPFRFAFIQWITQYLKLDIYINTLLESVFDKVNNTGIMDNRILLSPSCKLLMSTYNIYKPCWMDLG